VTSLDAEDKVKAKWKTMRAQILSAEEAHTIRDVQEEPYIPPTGPENKEGRA
jgi:hypothetical protein